MRGQKGRILPAIGVLLVMAFVGMKMTSRGWMSLDRLKDRVEAERPVPLVWPPALAAADEGFCHTVKLNLAQIEKAQEEGLAVDKNRRCISRTTMAEYEAEKARHAAARRADAARREEQAQIEKTVEQQISTGAITLQNLLQARAGLQTQIITALLPNARTAITPMPQPPAQWFVPMSYASGNLQLKAFVTPDPGGGRKQPLMVWLTGGDSNTLGDFWTEGVAANDQSAAAFRKAGMAMLFPTLRGGNDNPGQREYFWGEVQDVASAILQAAQLPYVDASRIYLGGHSTGATLALLTASAGLPVQGVFAFGPVDEISGYDWPVKWGQLPVEERRLRSPMYWLHGIKSPTWIIEGSKRPSNINSLDNLCAVRKSEQVHCVTVHGSDHFSVLQPMTRRIASQLVMGQPVQLQRDEKL
jgi:alpha/beta superfamily hydrolase